MTPTRLQRGRLQLSQVERSQAHCPAASPTDRHPNIVIEKKYLSDVTLFRHVGITNSFRMRLELKNVTRNSCKNASSGSRSQMPQRHMASVAAGLLTAEIQPTSFAPSLISIKAVSPSIPLASLRKRLQSILYRTLQSAPINKSVHPPCHQTSTQLNLEECLNLPLRHYQRHHLNNQIIHQNDCQTNSAHQQETS